MAPGKHGRQPRSRQQELFGDPEVMKMGEAIADVVEDVIGPTLSDEVFIDGAEAVHATSGVLVEPFLQLHPPPCSVRHYLSRITKYSGLSEEALVCSAALMNRICGNRVLHVRHFEFKEPEGKPIELSHFNAHRLVLACTLAAAKFNDEMHCSNSHWAKVGGVTTEEINDIEKAFLRLTRHRLLVDKPYFKACKRNVWLLSSQQAPQGSPTSVACSPTMDSNLDHMFQETYAQSDEESACDDEEASTTLALAGHALRELRDLDSIRVDAQASRGSGEIFDLPVSGSAAPRVSRTNEGVCTKLVSAVFTAANAVYEKVMPPAQRFASGILDGEFGGAAVPETTEVRTV